MSLIVSQAYAGSSPVTHPKGYFEVLGSLSREILGSGNCLENSRPSNEGVGVRIPQLPPNKVKV